MAQVNMPRTEQKDDALTTIMKGLQIAGSIYGIKTNMAQLEKYQAENDQRQALSEGKYDKNQQVALSEKYDVSTTQPQGGKYQQVTDLGSGSPIYLSLKKDTSPLFKEVQTIKDGKAGTLVVDVNTGKEQGFYPSAPKEKEAKTREITTLDAQGNPVIQIVADRPGQTFAAQPKEQKQPSKEQFDAALFGKRMETSNGVLGKLSQEGFNRADKREGIKALLPSVLQGSAMRQQDQAERNFVNAILRRESGAAISPSEFENAAQQYFPRAGDTGEVLAQKSQNREQAIEGMRAASGIAWEKVATPKIAKTKKDAPSGTAVAAPADQGSAGPKLGEISDGYEFLGGDPGNKKNWKEVPKREGGW